MNKQEFNLIEQWYTDFTEKYRSSDGSMHLVLQLKLDHSIRVAKDCGEIASDLGWSAGDIVTAEAIGLLHDVSRFPQFLEYKTFLDYKSFDHGERGFEIMADSDVLSPLTATDRNSILNSIRYHNRRKIEVDLDSDSMRMLHLIRDADKLDIFKIIYDTIKNNRHKDYPEILANINPDGPASPALVEEIRKHGYGSYEHVKTMTDMNLMRMTWVYTINYLPSLSRLVERKLLDQLEETMTQGPDTLELMAQARRFVAEKMEALRQ